MTDDPVKQDSEQEQQDAPAISLKDLVLDLNFAPAWAREPEVQEEQTPAVSEKAVPRRERVREPKGAVRGREKRGAAPERPAKRGPEAYPVLVYFLPEKTALGIAARDLHLTKRAVPLLKLADTFLSVPASCLVKIEVKATTGEHPAAPGAVRLTALYQCRVCSQVFHDQAAALAHVSSEHLELHFRKEVREAEPPSGQFTYVARCRLSGQLLGPPNHHSYNERLLNLYRRRFSHMPLDEYRQQIELVKDPTLIEEWRKSASKQEVFIPLDGADGSQELGRSEAEQIFARRYAKKEIREARRVILPMKVALALEDTLLREAVQAFLEMEKRNRRSMSMALRAAFHHMDFHTFVARRQVYVTAVRPRALNPAYATGPTAELLKYLESHPGCTRQEILAGLRPGLPPEHPEVMELVRHLSWLVEKGYVIEFFNGRLAMLRPSAQSGDKSGADSPTGRRTPPDNRRRSQ